MLGKRKKKKIYPAKKLVFRPTNFRIIKKTTINIIYNVFTELQVSPLVGNAL